MAQRILESSSRACGQVGHWKAECPNKPKTASSNPSGAGAFAGASIVQESLASDATMADVIDELPADAVAFMTEVRVEKSKLMPPRVSTIDKMGDNGKGI